MEPIKTAILSFGMSGQVFHGPFMDVHPGFEFYAVWERTKNIAEQKYPGVKTYRTLEEVLGDPEVELVIVNTPNYTHYEYAKKALEADKHVLVEKPFVTSVAQGEELVKLAKDKGLTFSVYHNRRFDSDFKIVKRVMDENMLGEIVEAEFHFDRYKEELSPKLHKENPGPGAGVLNDLGSHIIDQALKLFGKPEALFADIRTIRPASQVDDYFEVLLYYPQLRVRLHSSYLVREALPSYILHGTRGSFLKHRTDIQEKDLQDGRRPGSEGWGREPEAEKGLLHTEIDGKVVREYIASEPGNYMDYFEGIFQAIRNGQPEPVSASEGLDVIRIIEMAFKSNEQKTVLPLQF